MQPISLCRATTVALLTVFLLQASAAAQTVSDVTVPADGGDLTLRLWIPDGVTTLRGMMIWVHGNYGDDRWVANASGGDQALQLLAKRHAFGLIGVHFASNFASYNGDIRDVWPMETGINLLADTSSHLELKTAPLVIAGMSGGSGYAMNFANYRPERTIAFAHNKGGSYQQLSDWYGLDGAFQVPGLVCYGSNDIDPANPMSENDRAVRIKNTFRKDRAQGALWALLPDWDLGHDDRGYGRWFGALYLDRMIERRLPAAWIPGTAPTLIPVDPQAGWFGDNGLVWSPVTGGAVPRDVTPSRPVTITPVATSTASNAERGHLSWLPDEELARAWQAIATRPWTATIASPRTSGSLNNAHLVISPAGTSRNLTLTTAVTLTATTWFDGLTSVAGTNFQDTYGFHPLFAEVTAAGVTGPSDLTILGVTRGANQMPQLVTQPTTTTVRPDTAHPVSLSASATDPDGSLLRLLTYTWSVVSGPGPATFGATNGTNLGNSLLASLPASGTWVLRLTVTDAEGGSVSSTVTVEVRSPVNAAPLVTIPTPTVAPYLPLTTTLAATISDDDLPLGQAVGSNWSQVSGPASAIFGSVTDPHTTVTFADPGTYVLRLTATDTLLVGTADVTIEVPPAINRAPTVSAGPDQVLGHSGTATLAGTVTDDGLPGSGMTTTWRVVSGTGVAFVDVHDPTTAATFSDAGTVVLALDADDGLLTTSDTMTLRINGAPTVSLPTNLDVTLPASAQASGIVQDDHLPTASVGLAWTQISGPGTLIFSRPNLAITSITAPLAGIYVVRLTANDGLLATSADMTLTVAAANRAPVVSVGPALRLPAPGPLALPGQVSDDGLPAGGQLTSTWTQLSGPANVAFAARTDPATIATFPVPGTYVLSLSANDSNRSTTASLTIRVNAPPTILATTHRQGQVGVALTLDGTVTDSDSPAGLPLTSTWTTISGPGTVTFAQANNPDTTATFDQVGTYVLRLTADDGQQAAQLDITVEMLGPEASPVTDGTPAGCGSGGATAVILLLALGRRRRQHH